ncbi:MAG TPA: hypothetical protein EYO41_04075 [Candidatus Marinimicrobia bacterium]|nr:hypothetical protein [Candidatus Neomarinimicrobiota bacterium]
MIFRLRQLLLTSVVSISLLSGSSVYQQVRVFYSDPADLQEIREMGIPLDHVRTKKNVFIDLTATREQVAELESAGFQTELIHEDLTAFYQSRFNPDLKRDDGFELGSMGGNYTFAEYEAELDSLHLLYPDFVSQKESIGQSVEGRDIWAVKISDNVNQDESENEPQVLYTGVTHAREPLGMMNLIYFIYNLCENYGVDSDVSYLMDNREMWFIPIVNPDGYVYNESIEPNGGGMHRKNRQPACDGNEGIDLNRNYSFNWGGDWGSSGEPCSDVYRGESEFSEPETQAVSDFIMSKDFKNVLHYHAYSNLLIHSYGSGDYPFEPDLTYLREVGAEMTKYNNYEVGTGPETVGYMVNGDAVDWSYGDQGLIAYTPEIGGWTDGFWPATDRIVPLCEENLWPNLYFAQLAGTLLGVSNVEMSQEYVNPGDLFTITFDVENIGLSESPGPVMVTVTPINSIIEFTPVTVELPALNARESIPFPQIIDMTVSSSVGIGCQSGIEIILQSGEEEFSKTIEIAVGTPDLFMTDDAEAGMVNWIGGWGLSDEAAEGEFSFTDSPYGDYESWVVNTMELLEPFDLTETSNPELTFKARWEIEPNWDFVQVLARSGTSDEWQPLVGDYTIFGSGNGVQNAGEPGYDGTQLQWIVETMDISEFAGEPEVYLRFTLLSDGYVERDGFFVDDIKVLALPEAETGLGDVNGDCSVDVADILLIVDMILHPETIEDTELQYADLNHDQVIDVLDIVLLIQFILEG